MQALLATESHTLEHRSGGLEAVVNGTEADVKKFVESVSQEDGSAPVSGAGKGGSGSCAGRSALGLAAPTATVNELQCIASFDVISASLTESESHDCIKRIQKEVIEARKPIKDLQTAVANSTKDLMNARNLHQKGKSKGVAGKKGVKGKGKAGKAAAVIPLQGPAQV